MPNVGEPAPPLKVRDLTGSTVRLLDPPPPKAHLVMFSSVGCVPCRESEPLLVAAKEQRAGDLSVAIVMLAKGPEVRALLDAGALEGALTYYADTAGPGLFPGAGAYGVLGTPTTFLVGRDGRVLWRHVGRLTPAHVVEAIPAALGGDGGAVGIAANRP